MFQPEPTPFAAAYFPSSPFSYSPQTQTQSQSSSDAPPAGGPPPLDPTTFDFGYRIAVSGGGAGVGSGSGSAVPGAGVESAGRHHLGTPANCLATAAELKAARATASTTPSIRAGPPHPHQFHPDSHRTATASRNLPYGSFSATSPSSAASLSTSSPGNSALSTSPPSSCTAASPCSSYHSPTVSHQQHQLPLRNQPRAQQHGAHRHIHSRSPLIKMENQQQNPEQDQHGIAAQQAAAKDYQPDYEGTAMVGELTPSNVVTQEYAKADPIYVEKTVNLPHQFSHYRPIRGDGNCGWTAIGYSYFEKLVDHGNRELIQSEIERLTHFNTTCIAADQNYSYWEDFADAFLSLMTDVAKSIDNPSAAMYLVQQHWNDAETSNYLLFYLRLLTGVHLRLNASDYDAFVADSGGIIGYTASNVDMPSKEIEHIGINALVNVLLKPVNLSVEIAYLDLSPGSATNIYRFPSDSAGQDGASNPGLIYLLYRPTHYDILYRNPPVHALTGTGQMSAPFSVQVHRVGFADTAAIASTQGGLDMYGSVDFETLAMLPGFGGTGMSMSAPPLGPASAMSEPFSPTPQHHTAWSQFTNPFGPGPASSTQVLSPERAPPVIPAAPLSASVDMMPPQRKESHPSPEPRPRPVARTASGSSLGSGGVSIRFSPLQFQYDEGKEKFPDMTFQVTTNTFKNSVWNRAHFGNPDFHPEEWSPEDENIDGRLASRKKSK